MGRRAAPTTAATPDRHDREAVIPTLDEVLALDRQDDDVFHTRPVPTSLPNTFGGQHVAQALNAALRTVPEHLHVHSLHGYFLRAGRPQQPATATVQRLREGRSFATRRVELDQEAGTVFSAVVSFHADEPGGEHQDTMPVVPEPEDVPPFGEHWTGLFRTVQQEWPDWDLRPVEAAGADSRPREPRQQYWLRHRPPLAGADLNACALAYFSDVALVGTAAFTHFGERVTIASLDHAIWFLRPFRIDDWLLYDQQSPSAAGGRALGQGRLFDRAGRLVAVVVQEGLVRRLR